MTASAPPSPPAPVIALVAGEESGDVLGGDLAHALLARAPGARLVGIGGRRMRAAGVECWHDIEALSVMGLAEVLRHLPRLLRLRRELARRLRTLQPDVVVGIDAPDFNLGLERRLKRAGLRTAHYVSPSVWAWREGRARRMGRSADRVLCLLPMEPAIYARHGVDARFVGHPLAARFPLAPARAEARGALGLAADARVLAVLPGSRASEISRLAGIFLAATERIARASGALTVLLPAANPRCHAALRALLDARPGLAAQSGLTVRLLDGQAGAALAAADAALLASGTVALEAMLAKCPMVVAYRLAPLTHFLVRSLHLLKTSSYSLPNVLAGEALVPELMQRDCHPQALADAVLGLLAAPDGGAALRARFTALHQQLLGADPDRPPAAQAAAAVLELLPARSDRT